ncbi:hypothetical protein, partial [Burkholderia ubonensis]|uniref:hypothetical protein n=1 Tax=Burkholderia ubonensis TaxID=101571 RepID=UPI001E5A7D4B
GVRSTSDSRQSLAVLGSTMFRMSDYVSLVNTNNSAKLNGRVAKINPWENAPRFIQLASNAPPSRMCLGSICLASLQVATVLRRGIPRWATISTGSPIKRKGIWAKSNEKSRA